jgi:hypothetical protein
MLSMRAGLLTKDESSRIPFGEFADAVDSKLKENAVKLGVQCQASAVARGTAGCCMHVLARVLLDIAVDS